MGVVPSRSSTRILRRPLLRREYPLARPRNRKIERHIVPWHCFYHDREKNYPNKSASERKIPVRETSDWIFCNQCLCNPTLQQVFLAIFSKFLCLWANWLEGFKADTTIVNYFCTYSYFSLFNNTLKRKRCFITIHVDFLANVSKKYMRTENTEA